MGEQNLYKRKKERFNFEKEKERLPNKSGSKRKWKLTALEYKVRIWDRIKNRKAVRMNVLSWKQRKKKLRKGESLAFLCNFLSFLQAQTIVQESD